MKGCLRYSVRTVFPLQQCANVIVCLVSNALNGTRSRELCTEVNRVA
jgi:hypothetical protein